MSSIANDINSVGLINRQITKAAMMAFTMERPKKRTMDTEIEGVTTIFENDQ